MFDKFRDCLQWKNDDLQMSTTSNEAVKLYDAALHQIITYKDNEQLGGIKNTLDTMLQADPNFVLGKLLAMEMELSLVPDSKTKSAIKEIVKSANSNQMLNKRERKHILAIDHWSEGRIEEATETWNQILMEHPLDLHALQFSNQMYLDLGDTYNLQESVARLIPSWKPHSSLYGSLYAMYGFGLEENNRYDEASKAVDTALAYDRMDSRAHHCRFHVYEMRGELEKGLENIEKTETLWNTSNMLACHNYWHWTLFLVEQGDFEAALEIFDTHLLPRVTDPNIPYRYPRTFRYTDAASLLYRLQIEGVQVGQRWRDLHDVIVNYGYVKDHESNFMNSFYVMGALNTDDVENVRQLVDFDNESSESSHYYRSVRREVTGALHRSMELHHNRLYADCVDLLYPVRFRIQRIGGSWAQRDVFHWMLIDAASKSHKQWHNHLAKQLINERIMKKDTPAITRMQQRLLNAH